MNAKLDQLVGKRTIVVVPIRGSISYSHCGELTCHGSKYQLSFDSSNLVFKTTDVERVDLEPGIIFLMPYELDPYV